MTLHAGLRISFRDQYLRSSRGDLVDQVPEVESQDAAYARWQRKMADPSVVAEVEARYREALDLENRAMSRLTSPFKRLLARVGALVFTFLAAVVWAQIATTIGNGGQWEGRSVSPDRWIMWVGEAVVFSAIAAVSIPRFYRDLRKSELSRAIAIHSSLFAEHPDFANAACRLAYAWQVASGSALGFSLEAAAKSVDAAMRASSADPEFEMPYFLAGMALKILGQSKSSTAWYVKRRGVPFGSLADEAAAAYRKAIALNPRFAAARNNLGLILVDKRDFEGAVEQFEAMLRDFPDAKNATANLSLAEKRYTRDGHTSAEFKMLVKLVVDHLPLPLPR